MHISGVASDRRRRIRPCTFRSTSEVRIYKRKQESKNKGRKHALDQENDQEKKKVFYFFLGRFLGRERVFFLGRIYYKRK